MKKIKLICLGNHDRYNYYLIDKESYRKTVIKKS